MGTLMLMLIKVDNCVKRLNRMRNVKLSQLMYFHNKTHFLYCAKYDARHL